jgi:site-specific DNA recombinase
VLLPLSIAGINSYEVVHKGYQLANGWDTMSRDVYPMPSRRPATYSRCAIAYLRVSTDDQALGPEAQRAAIGRWALAAWVEVVGWHVDQGVSGAVPLDRRPALLAAVADLEEQGAGVLVVTKRDRLARDVMAAAMIESMAARVEARVLSAAGEGDARSALLMRRMVDAFAEYERALISARTRAALAVKRGRGELTGTAPLGQAFADDGIKLVEDAAERRALYLIGELRAGGMSLRAIVDELNARGIPARGERWHLTTVARLCRVAG